MAVEDILVVFFPGDHLAALAAYQMQDELGLTCAQSSFIRDPVSASSDNTQNWGRKGNRKGNTQSSSSGKERRRERKERERREVLKGLASTRSCINMTDVTFTPIHKTCFQLMVKITKMDLVDRSNNNNNIYSS